MKLLFDHNLSPSLTEEFVVLFPESKHVRDVGLERAGDDEVWNFARKNGYAIVSKDSDFHQRSFLFGFPPKVVWVQVGNKSTQRIIEIMRQHTSDIQQFCADEIHAFLLIS